jgi:hypothetical protein
MSSFVQPIAWLYGKFFVGLPAWAGYGCAFVVAGLLACVLWAYGIDQYRETHPSQPTAEVKPPPPSAAPTPAPVVPVAGPSVTPEDHASSLKVPLEPKAAGPNQMIANAPGGLISINQQGGIAAGTVIVDSPAPTITADWLRRKEPVEQGKYVSELKLTVSSQDVLPRLVLHVSSPTLLDAEIVPTIGGFFQSSKGQGDGYIELVVPTASGSYRVTAWTSKPDNVRVEPFR